MSQVERTRAALEDINGDDAILIIHSGTIRATLSIALGATPRSSLSFVVDPLSITAARRHLHSRHALADRPENGARAKLARPGACKKTEA